jgi:2-phospho-L-lactate guanylyltransferase (CobY/MobA/RfbA family)
MQPPPLSITMPTRNRPGLLERALRSVVRAVASMAEHIEVAVSDGGATRHVVARVLTDRPARYRYVWNRPALPG